MLSVILKESEQAQHSFLPVLQCYACGWHAVRGQVEAWEKNKTQIQRRFSFLELHDVFDNVEFISLIYF